MKVYSGQKMQGAVSARDWNAMQDATAWAAQRQLDSQIKQSTARMPPGGVVVKNSAGADVPRFYAVGLQTVGFTETDNAVAYKEKPYFVGAAVSRDYYGRFAILQEQLASGVIGIGIASGITHAYVNIQHADHDRADINNSSNNYLYSNFYGSAEILYKPSGTGLKLCIVRVGSFVAPARKAIAAADISAGNSGTVTIKKGSSDSQQVTAYLNWMAGTTGVSAGDELMVKFLPYPDSDQWVIVGAEC